MVRIEADVMTDVKVQVAIPVEIGEGRGGGIVTQAGQSRARCHILEGPIASIAEQVITAQSRDEKDQGARRCRSRPR